MPNLTDELSTAQERSLNQFGMAVLVWCGKSVKFDRVCQTFVELNSGSTHGTPSESDARRDQMSRQCRSKVELIQLGSAHEKYGV